MGVEGGREREGREIVINLCAHVYIFRTRGQLCDFTFLSCHGQAELDEWKRMYEMNVEKEKAALEDAVKKRKDEEQKAEAAALKLKQIQQEEGLTRIEGALRHRRQGEEVKEAERKLQRLEAEEQAVNTKKGESNECLD